MSSNEHLRRLRSLHNLVHTASMHRPTGKQN